MSERVPVLIERSYLVRETQRFRVMVEVPDDAPDKEEAAHYTAQHAIERHFTAFDEDVRNSEPVSGEKVVVDEPVTLEVVSAEDAKIIPMRRP
jgi:hypothetical protein